ncbi:PDZ/DHR/GLGF domain protein [Necator americanus]|uniref:PDZ/DHR/GLGF domain protein n=1 Tax=Necator americanus TaxID=51031 RepID=W2TIM1_NECAM|nr:PDZ/DHR/GLGF domain protein [Necator americanus]ETN81429.1 PDZ/DHR/GLGF domain protein [Necator americanus]
MSRKPLLFSETSRKLPQRPTGSGSVARNIKTYRVRFADEVNSGASTSSTCSEQSNKSTRCATAVPQRQQPNLDRLGNYSYPIEEVDTLRPPSYDFAINRLRRKEKPRESIRDFVIRQNVNEALSRKLRSRSSSLPRMDREYDTNESFYSPQLPPSYQIDDSRNLTLRSLDNLNIDCDSHIVDSSRRRKLPVAPLLGRMVNARINRQFDPDFGLHSTLIHRPSEEHLALQRMSRRSASIGPQCEILDYGTRKNIPRFRREAPAVRAVLVALDQCGFRTVMVEKTQPGPFGFYIATGVMNGQRGIFISRVSIASLSPMLSVGDEILYVDDQLVKGRSLETVQALIAGKTKVMIVLLPAIGSCI